MTDNTPLFADTHEFDEIDAELIELDVYVVDIARDSDGRIIWPTIEEENDNERKKHTA